LKAAGHRAVPPLSFPNGHYAPEVHHFKLPDLVAALHASAPVTKFALEMQGGKKGLIVNRTDICRGKHRALANFDAQNGRIHDFKAPAPDLALDYYAPCRIATSTFWRTHFARRNCGIPCRAEGLRPAQTTSLD
jgi:hypothetical protein